MQKKWWFFSLLLVLSAGQALAGSDWGTEGGGNKPCMNAALPPNLWTLVAYDNAGQPCMTKPDADQTCDASATWDWQLHGSLRLAGAASATAQVQLWVGNGGGACYGGTKDPIICDNPATHFLQEGGRFALQGGAITAAVPFEFLMYQAQPWFATPGDANYFGFWLFVKPTVWTSCRSVNYSDLVYRDEAQ